VNNKSFFDSFETHTKIKLDIYNEYLRRYLPILLYSQYVDSIHIYDMFCGRGYTSDGHKGSAVLGIEEVVNSVTTIGSSKHVHLNLSDCDEENCLVLGNIVNTLQIPSNIFVDVSCKEFHHAVSESILRHMDKSVMHHEKILFFIDPYGYKEADPHTILDIKKNENAEVILFVPVRHMFRFYNSTQPNKSLDKWRDFLGNPDGITDISEFIRAICTRFTDENINASYFMLTSQKSGNEYALFFLSSNLLGLEKFNEVKWNFDRVQGIGIKKDFECSFASCIENDLHKNELSILKENIISTIDSLPRSAISNVDLYELIVKKGYLPKHFNQLLADDKFLNKKYTGDKRNGNYLSYKYYSKSEVLVLFSARSMDVNI
jgi:three-Cys-motif partner protein